MKEISETIRFLIAVFYYVKEKYNIKKIVAP
jgi:hypothetical protein